MTPTPGAASELTYCPKCGRIRPNPHNCFDDPLTPPAPVQVNPVDRGGASDSTKESSREAVAWMSDFSPDLVISAKAMREAIECGDIGYGFSIDSYTIPLYTALPPTDRLVKHMVNRFLGWRLPKPWHPDNGISYTRPNYAHPEAEHDWPTGTNLFDATQAEAMVRHMLEGAPPPPDRVQPERVEADARFFIDHGMIHDRETGKHVTTLPATELLPDGEEIDNSAHGLTIEETCALLNCLDSKPFKSAPPPPDRVQQREQETIDALAASQDAAATFSDSYAALVKRIWNLAKEWRMEAAAMRSPDGKTILVQCAEELDNARANSPDRVQPERVEAGLFRRSLHEFYEAIKHGDELAINDPRMLRAAALLDTPARESKIGPACGHTDHWNCHGEAATPSAPPTDASGGVTDADIAFLRDVANWLAKESKGTNPSYELRSGFLDAAANAVSRAADRARKPGYRQVTLEDARKLIHKMWNTNGGWTDADTLTKTLLAGMQHIGAVIPDAGK